MASLVHKYPPQKYCPADAFAPWFNLFGHDPLKKKHVLSAQTSGAAPGGAALFRDPRKRLWSAYQSLHSQGMGGERKAKLVATVKSAADYARFPGIAGCQVKMLTGNQCAAASPITPAVVAEAKERLRSTLGFVGHADAEITADMDPYDMELYDEARKIFVERLREHGLIVPPELTPAAPATADQLKPVPTRKHREVWGAMSVDDSWCNAANVAAETCAYANTEIDG
eukprot:gene2262-11704_t